MTDTFRNLDRIESGYTVFEKDQVLTPGQLNGVSSYLDDQERLSRVALLGVGIGCGLWPLLQGNRVRLSHGVGTTTDGDVLFLPGATFYDRYKLYDTSAPKYPQFYRGEEMILAYELVREGESDSRALALSGFETREGVAPGTLAAVLYVESCLHDEDLCTGTDCDNRGKDWVHATKLLLVEPKSAAALAGALDTPDRAARTPLEPVVIARPILQGALAAEADLAAVYRKACDAIHKALVTALGTLYKPCKWFLQDIAPADPAPRWQKSLIEIRGKVPDRGVQYYYDFLKDVAETYNAFRDALFGDTAVCCPDLNAFPKHLVLGSLDTAQRAAVGRTGFHPSPMVSERVEQRVRARFLIRKLDALVSTFAIPGGGDIRITPSVFENRSLEERAIPFYYTVTEQAPIYRAWSYKLSQRGMERHNYSYNADRYAAEGAAKAPLEAQVGAFEFFRIEGHVGRSVGQVMDALQKQIKGNNLPIDLVALSLGQPPTKPPFPWRNQGLYPLRDLLRADLAAQLDDAGRFGAKFVEQVKAAGTAVTDADNNGVPVLGTAQTKTELMAGHVKAAMAKVLRDDYDSGSNWQDDVTKLTQTAAEMNEALSPVTKKEFVTPLDTVISGHPARWLTWVDILIKDAEVDAARRSELPGFLAEHPGLEHYAGVLRGGTFVLVYDATGTVVADLMLPYQCCEPKAAPPKPPKLVPPIRPDIVFEKPIRLVPFPDKFRFEKFRDDFVKDMTKDIEVKTSYFNAFKDSIGIIVGAKGGGGFVQPGGGLVQSGQLSADPLLDLHVADTTWKTQKVDTLRTQLLNPGLDEAKRTTLEKQLETAETELGTAILTTTEFVATSGIDIKPGSDGARVMSTTSAALAKVSNINALADIEKGLMSLGNRTATEPEMKTMIGNVLTGRGIR